MAAQCDQETFSEYAKWCMVQFLKIPDMESELCRLCTICNLPCLQQNSEQASPAQRAAALVDEFDKPMHLLKLLSPAQVKRLLKGIGGTVHNASARHHRWQIITIWSEVSFVS